MALSEAGLSQLFLQKLDSIKAGGFQAADCPRVTGGLDVPFFSESLLACLPAFSVLCYYHLSSNHHGCAGGTSQSGNPDLEERNSDESSLSQGVHPCAIQFLVLQTWLPRARSSREMGEVSEPRTCMLSKVSSEESRESRKEIEARPHALKK